MNEREIAVYRTSLEATEHFTVPVNDRTTIIDALEHIRLNYDPELMFRQSCHHGSCGTCGMVVNGKFVLACTERIADQDTEKPIRVEPLPTMDQIGDLAFDPTRFMQEFPDGLTYMRDSEVNKNAETPEGIDTYTRFENCIECGLCVSTCPVNEDWMGPAAVAAVQRQMDKEPERFEELLDLVDGARGAWNCMRDFSCVWVCPTGVKPGQKIMKVKKHLKKRDQAAAAAAGTSESSESDSADQGQAGNTKNPESGNANSDQGRSRDTSTE